MQATQTKTLDDQAISALPEIDSDGLIAKLDTAKRLIDTEWGTVGTEPKPRPVLSVVMPCLNEADTLAVCIRKAYEGLAKLPVPGEVIVADNGSTDGSREIAIELGARLIDVPQRGYGAALMAGIASAHGEYCVMGDADDSYDFREIDRFYESLLTGADLVQGCRLPSGGGQVLPGAMPWLHRWLGNPVLTFLAVHMFRAPVHDVYCGLRGFRKSWQQRLDQRCIGMEFAVEMIVKGTLFGTRISEVPICLYPDGRKSHPPHLRTFRDGWRTLRFFLLHSPRHTFLMPGGVFCGIGGMGFLAALSGLRIGGGELGAHSLLVAGLFLLIGVQLMSCAVIAKVFASGAKLLPVHGRLERFLEFWNLERSLLTCASMVAIGTGLIGMTAWRWVLEGFGPLPYATTLQSVVPGVGLIALATQLAATSFVVSVLRMARI